MTIAIPIELNEYYEGRIADDFWCADRIGFFQIDGEMLAGFVVKDLNKEIIDNLQEYKVHAVIAGMLQPVAVQSFHNEGITCYSPKGREIATNLSQFLHHGLMVLNSSNNEGDVLVNRSA